MSRKTWLALALVVITLTSISTAYAYMYKKTPVVQNEFELAQVSCEVKEIFKNIKVGEEDVSVWVPRVSPAEGFSQETYRNGVIMEGCMNAGITVMGGLLGGAAAFLLLYFSLGRFVFKGKKKDWHKKYFNDVFLIAPICITVAHAFGRIGCLMSGCCHGAFLGKDYVFGGIKMYGSVTSASGNTVHKWGYFVPTQLYESLFLFALFAVLSILYFKRCNILMAIYLIAYAVWRMFIEFFRTDARGAIILGLAPSQWMSIIFVLMGAGILLFYHYKKIPFFLPKENEQEK